MFVHMYEYRSVRVYVFLYMLCKCLLYNIYIYKHLIIYICIFINKVS